MLFGVMRNVGGYTWDTILEEEVAKSIASIMMIQKEHSKMNREVEKMKRRSRLK